MFPEKGQIEPVMSYPPVEQLSGIGQRQREESGGKNRRKKQRLNIKDSIEATLEDEQSFRAENPPDGHIDFHA